MLDKILQEQGLTKYKLAKLAGVPHATLNDICNGKTRLEKCSAETIYKLARALHIPMETLVEAALEESRRQFAFEHGLPEYLQHDLDAFKDGVKHHSSLLDCLWGELYSSINIAEINEQVITAEHAGYLRKKFLYGGQV